MKLPSIFFKNHAKDLDNLPKESFIDVIAQNLFLKRLAFFLILGLTAALTAVAIQANQKTETIIVTQAPNVSYHDAPAPLPTDNVSLSSATTPQTTPSPPGLPGNETSGRTPTGRSPLRRHITSPPPESPSASAAPQANPSALPAQSRRAGLWDLSDRLKVDPRREVLEKAFSVDGITVKFREASPEGLFRFEIINDTQNPIYLPNLQIQGKQSQVFLEHRVLEANSRDVGILQAQNLDGAKKLSMIFSAANVQAMSISLEVPQW